jgi:hypothetical protein
VATLAGLRRWERWQFSRRWRSLASQLTCGGEDFVTVSREGCAVLTHVED